MRAHFTIQSGYFTNENSSRRFWMAGFIIAKGIKKAPRSKRMVLFLEK
jgi:hypothetical protein